MKKIKINVFEQIAGSAAVSSEDGEELFNKIVKGLEEKDVLLILDWTNITLITSTFLNTSIGQLYSRYDSSFLRERLKIENLTKEDMELLKRVIERAKEYFKNKEKIDSSIKETLGDE